MQRITRVEHDHKSIMLWWNDGRDSVFHHFWLRDNSPQARHPETGHRVEETSLLAGDIRPRHLAINDTGGLEICWSDGHESLFSADWLRKHDYFNGARSQPPLPDTWGREMASKLPRIEHAAFLQDINARIRWLQAFRRTGLGIMHGIPEQDGIVLDIAQSIGQVRVTSWGKVFDVKAVPRANSVAYTNLPLVLHTDEAYRDPVPTIQLTHFVRSSASGGEATLVDGFKLAEVMRAQSPEQFQLLAETSLHFHFREADMELEHHAPVLTLDPEGRLKEVRYSNHSVQPFLLPPEAMEAFYEAYRAFGALRDRPEYRLELDMQAGDMYMVDNRRVMHGRKAFRSGGHRHLQSCYVDTDEAMGRLAVLERKHAEHKHR